METTSDGHLKHIEPIAKEDAAGLLKAHQSYGDSWKKRGGIGAYMVMIRKFDRMERQVEKYGYDVVKAVQADQRSEGLIDDIRDARRYLMLIESWLREMGLVKAGDHRDNVPDMSDMLENDPRNIVGRSIREKAWADGTWRDLPTDRAKQPVRTTQIECMAHIPDAACGCARCVGMANLVDVEVPHAEDCECKICSTVTRLIKKTMDRLKTDRKRKEPVIGLTLMEAKKRLYEDNPHPVACECAACNAGRADRAKVRGCHPQCGCNECLADYYLEQNHEK